MTSEDKPNAMGKVAEGIATFAEGVSKAGAGVIGVAGGLVSGVGDTLTAASQGGVKLTPEEQAKVNEATAAAYDKVAKEQAKKEGRDEITPPNTDQGRGAWIAS